MNSTCILILDLLKSKKIILFNVMKKEGEDYKMTLSKQLQKLMMKVPDFQKIKNLKKHLWTVFMKKHMTITWKFISNVEHSQKWIWITKEQLMEAEDNPDFTLVSNHVRTMTQKKEYQGHIIKIFLRLIQDHIAMNKLILITNSKAKSIDILYAYIKMMLVNKQYMLKNMVMKI